VRLRGLEQEFEGQVEFAWKSFLLRPKAEPGRDLEKFRRYTRSWQRPASDEDAAEFREWQSDAGPPTHSIPPHLVAKAAAQLGEQAFRAVHDRLLHAYFVESRDTSDPAELLSIWRDAGLDAADFGRHEDPELLRQVIDEHNEAIELGVTGVPAVGIADDDIVITGAHPRELYRRWIRRALDTRPV
jgi:predicted DsbA family dithiol-disulfide isomerase